MKTVKRILIIALMLAPVLAIGQETEEPIEPTEPDTTEAPVLNATQADRVSRLSEASGETEENIIRMRNGLPPVSEEGEVGSEEPEAEAPKGRGWGVIAKWLGLHPSVSGKGNGDKPNPKDDEATMEEPEEEENLLTTRERVRDKKLYREEHMDREKKSEKVSREERNTIRAEKRERKTERVKDNKPAKPERPDKPNRGKKR